MTFTTLFGASRGADLFIYVRNDGPITWDEANDAASTIDRGPGDAHLATITNQKQSDFISNLILPEAPAFDGLSGPWIGLSRGDMGGPFEWVTGEDLAYTNWSPGQPDNFSTPERWVQFWRGDAVWNDNDQSFPRESISGFMVELDARAANRITGTEGDDRLATGGGADRVSGKGGDDTLQGGGGKDVLKGNAGNDILEGGGKADRLLGGTGDDSITGGGGKDVLRGQAGADTLVGCGGRDTFVLSRNDGSDTISLFEDNRDTLRLNDNLWGGGLTLEEVLDQFVFQSDNNVFIGFGIEGSVVIENFTKEALVDDLAIF